MISVSDFSGYDQRLARIRASFVAQGSSFHAWCKGNGINTQNARKAVLGKWKGPGASALVAKIEKAAGVCDK